MHEPARIVIGIQFMNEKTTGCTKIEKLNEKFKVIMEENNVLSISIPSFNISGKYDAICKPSIIWKLNFEIDLTKGLYEEMDLKELEFCVAHE